MENGIRLATWYLPKKEGIVFQAQLLGSVFFFPLIYSQW